MWYIGRAVRTELTNASRPTRFNRRPFQHGSLAPTLSTRACSAARRVLPICSGNPKYLVGKDPVVLMKLAESYVVSKFYGWIRYIANFCKFVCSPEAAPKAARICCTLWRS